MSDLQWSYFLVNPSSTSLPGSGLHHDQTEKGEQWRLHVSHAAPANPAGALEHYEAGSPKVRIGQQKWESSDKAWSC